MQVCAKFFLNYSRCASRLLKDRCTGRFYASMSNLVTVTEDEKTRTATVTMNRPPVNSLNLEMFQELRATIKDLEQKKFRGLVLSSSSPTVFSAGLDIMEMYKPKEDRFRDFWRSLQDFWKTLYLTPLVTIAAINGHSPAGGCMMAMSCDYRVMLNAKCTIGLNEAKLGILAPRWFQRLFISTIGFQQAEKALKLGTLFTPQQALSLGLVDELASDAEDLKAKVQSQMALWLKVPSAARQMCKISLREAYVNELKSYENQELEQVWQFVKSDLVQESLGKYLESMKARKE